MLWLGTRYVVELKMPGSHIIVFNSGCEMLMLNDQCLHVFCARGSGLCCLALQGMPGQAGSSALRVPGQLVTALLGCVLAYVLHHALSE